MCGIAGLVALDGLDTVAAERRMAPALARLSARGPDGEGRWHDEHCLFGHRRLAIVDLSPSGAQPMVRGDLAMVFNGMIYNYRALRRELRALGHVFTSDTDTEILLCGWREWGEATLPKLTGMFAFALWDSSRRILTLARDRFGKKPLFYRARGGELAFASDLRALEHLGASGDAIDRQALRWLLTLRYIPEPWSILAGTRKLPPGHVAQFSLQGLALRRWYDLGAAPRLRYGDEREAARDLRARVEAAVAERLVADVPVGAFLSGGVDSAIVAAAMRKSTPRVRTYTVGFEGAAEYYEERPAAKRVADFLGTEHVEIAVGTGEAVATVARVFDALDEPFADSSAIPAFIVAAATRRHVTVALSGDGGDEVFGGYRKYQGELRAKHYRALPGWLRRGAIEPLAGALPESKKHPLLEKARRLRRFVAHAGAAPAARQAGWMRLAPQDEVDALLGPDPAPYMLEALVERLREVSNYADETNQMLYADVSLGLPGDMLAKVDRTGMAHGLEVRCPLLDQRVVEAAFSMPGEWKLKPGIGKAVLRQAFAAALPSEVFARPKKGFEVPLGDWLMGPLHDLAVTATAPPHLAELGLNPEIVGGWWRDLRSGRRDSSEKIWTVVALSQWTERRIIA